MYGDTALMFTCDECHKRIYGEHLSDVHLFGRSMGQCEWCHEAHACADCHCPAPKSQMSIHRTRMRKSELEKEQEMTRLKTAEIREKFRKKR